VAQGHGKQEATERDYQTHLRGREGAPEIGTTVVPAGANA